MKKIILITFCSLLFGKLFAQCNMQLIAFDSTLCLSQSSYISAFSTDTISGVLPLNYCVCKPISANNTDIERFALGTIHNVTNCNTPLFGSQGLGTGQANVYANFEGSTVPKPVLNAGNLVSFAVDINSCSSPSTCELILLIDFNRDGDFADTLETVYTLSGLTSPMFINNSFTVPSGVSNGFTKLRVIVKEGTATVANGCGVFSEGEVEDYVVNLNNNAITYNWQPSAGLNISTGSTVVANPIVNSTYTVTSTNTLGCTSSSTIFIQAATSALGMNLSGITDITCFGANNGGATATVTGGILPYTYTWVPSNATTATATNLHAGLNTVTVIDAFGCSIAIPTGIFEPSALLTNSTFTNSLCFAPATGSINITTSGGIAPYTFTHTPSVGSGSILNNLAGGVYTTVVTDANSCTKSVVHFINAPTAIISTIAIQPNNATAYVNGGLPPYTYSWMPGNLNTQTVNAVGNFTLTITDINGCIDLKIIDIPAPTSVNTVSQNIATIFTQNNTLHIIAKKLKSIAVMDMLGKNIFFKNNYTQDTEAIELHNTPAMYLVKIINQRGETYVKKIMLR